MRGDAALAAPVYRIRANVARVRRDSGVLLVAPAGGRPVRISRPAEALVQLLVDGASFEALAQHLRERQPAARDIESKLERFLGQLERAGLLGIAARRRGAPVPRMRFNVDPLAHWLARQIQRVPAGLAWGCLIAVGVGALAALAVLIGSGHLPHPRALFAHFNPWGLAWFAGVVVVLHETAHAVACRLAGVRVTEAGFVLHAGCMPGPYVDTGQMYCVARRAPRFWVAAAGPLVDALGLAAAALWLLLAPSGASAPVATTLFLLCAAALYLDTNPLAPSDGSRMLEALLGDDLARRSALSRRRARLSTPATVAWYRAACSLHLQASLVLLYFWWVHA